MILKDTLQEIETLYTSEDNISTRLKKDLPKDTYVVDADFELKSEIFAFDMFPNYRAYYEKGNKGWGTYFGPMSVWGNQEYPSLEEITTDMIEYWNKRSQEASNPILIGRYADLVWDFSELITGNKPSHEIAERVITSYVNIANEIKGFVPVYTLYKLERALNIACSLNNKTLIEKCKNTIISYEKKVGEDRHPGLWGRAYDNLVFNNKVSLTEQEEESIINDLEERLVRVTNKNSLDLNAADRAVKALIEYYKKKQRKDDVKRIIKTIEEANLLIEADSTAMQLSSWLHELSCMYKENGYNEDYKRVLKRIENLGPKRYEELKPIPFEIPIEKELIDLLIAEIFIGNVTDILTRIANSSIPNHNDARNYVQDPKNRSFMSLISTDLLDSRGTVKARIGSIEDDLEGQITKHISQGLYLGSVFLQIILDKASTDYPNFKEELTLFITQSPVISTDRIETIKSAINHHFEGRYSEAVHLLVPQFEAALRNLAHILEDNILQDNSRMKGAHNYRLLTYLLNLESVKKVLGEDVVIYFKVVYNERKGWNLRNDLCHGLTDPSTINRSISERVIHTFLVLGLIKSNN